MVVADSLARELPTDLSHEGFAEAVRDCCRAAQTAHRSTRWPAPGAFLEYAADTIARWRSKIARGNDTAKPHRQKPRPKMPLDRQRVAAVIADYEARRDAGTLTGVAARVLELRDSLQSAGVIDRYGAAGPNATAYSEMHE